jgi:hypothetical protein
LIVFKFSQTYIKKFIKFSEFQICAYFSLALVVVEFLAIVIFDQIKVARHIWEQYCQLMAETGS